MYVCTCMFLRRATELSADFQKVTRSLLTPKGWRLWYLGFGELVALWHLRDSVKLHCPWSHLSPEIFQTLVVHRHFLINSSRLQLFMGNFESAWHRSDLSFAFECTWVTPLSLPGCRGRVTLPKWGLRSSQHPHLATPFNCNLLFSVSWEEFFAMLVLLNWQVWKSQNIVLSNGSSRWLCLPPSSILYYLTAVPA